MPRNLPTAVSQTALITSCWLLKNLTSRKRVIVSSAIIFALTATLWSLTPRSSALTNAGVITTIGVPLTENFDTLATSGTFLTWTDNSTLPGWYSTRATYNTGNGASATGSLQSYGVAGTNPVTDRALGTLASGGTGPLSMGARFFNNTGVTITSFQIQYVGEQWRNGGNTTPQTLQFQYQVVNANAISTINAGAWTSFNALDFTSLVNTASASQLDGNNPANRASRSATLTVNVNPTQEIWFRWLDVDDAGNDHGFGVDDFSVVPLHSDPPSINSATATPSTLNPGEGTLLSVTVTPGAAPTSTGMTVTADLSTIGGSASQPLFDDGTNGDQVANDLAFSFQTTVANATPGGAKNLPVTVADAELRSTSGSIPLTINASSPLAATGSANPNLVRGGEDSLLTVNVTPGGGPPSTSVNVTSDLSSIGGSSTQQFYDDGTHGDLTAGNNVYSFLATVPTGLSSGAKSLPVIVTDAQARVANTSISLNVVPNVVINELDSDTVGTDNMEFVELYDGGTGNTSLDGVVVVFFNGSNDLSYATFNLDGRSTDANGYFTLGNAAVPGVDLVFADNLLQNGADAVAVYFANASNFPTNTPITTTNLLDAVVYDTADADDPGLLTLLNPGEPQVNENGGGSGTTQSIQRCPNGSGGARNTSTFTTGTPSSHAANNCFVTPPATGNNAIVISQVYGGGGNTGATFLNDFVELYNRGTSNVDLSGWSLQYASASGNSWDLNKQPLGGVVGPGEYFLIKLAGGGNGSSLPDANINGEINISGTNGKIALVSNFDGLVGNCPTADPDVVDFVGYGSADCHEGLGNAPSPSNTTAIFRQGGGTVDTNNNGNDFVVDVPSPRRTAPIVELGPLVLNTDPHSSGVNAPRDASINVTFTEPVTVSGSWFNINCVSTGLHNSATVAGSDKDWVITPNVNFMPGEQCTVTIDKDSIHDVDTDDSNPNTDTLPTNYSWTFTVSTGTAPPYPSSVHLDMGNPSGATADTGVPNNYLMEKPEFALSYNRDNGGPNWVSWHLSDEWVGTLTRVDTFRPDPAVLPEWYRVQASDFSSSGFDRGHMTPNADRDKETSIPINQATFLMSNMVAQSPDNNQGPWAAFENYLRTLLPDNELYVVAGPRGTGGTGSNGFANSIANGHVHVPSSTWKVVLVIPKGDNDLARVNAGSRTIAIDIPNTQGIRNDAWENYLTTVDNVEALTGYDFFANVPDAVENAIEAGTNGVNPPGTENGSATTAEDVPVGIGLHAVSPLLNPNFSSVIVGAPAHGALSGSGLNVTYTPDPDYHGPDSFTFKVNDGEQESNTSTVNVTVTEVNDSPVAVDDSKATDEDTKLDFSAMDLIGNDVVGPADESLQQLTVTSVTGTTNTHGTVALSNGVVTYQPEADYNGPASFTYQVCDNGTTNSSADFKCSTATVNVNLNAVNDNPSGVDDTATTNEDESITVDVVGNDTDVDGDARTLQSVGNGANGSVTIVAGQAQYSPNTNFNGTDTFTYVVSDGQGGTATGTVHITVNAVNDLPSANSQSVSTAGNTPASITLSGNDVETPSLSLNYQTTVNPTHGTLTGSGANRTYTPALNYSGPDSFKFTVTDSGDGNAAPLTSNEATVTITVNDTINPTITAPANLNLGTGQGATNCSLFISEATLGTASANDNSGSVSMQRSGVPAGNVFPVGTTIITYTAIDGAGNTSTATQTVVVRDTTPPSFNAPSGVTVNADSSGQATVPNFVAGLIAQENCGGQTTFTQNPVAGTMVGLGTHVITITATDQAGNSTSQTTTFTVQANNGGMVFSLDVSPAQTKRGKTVKLRASFSNNTGARESVTFTFRYSSPCGNFTIGNVGPVTINNNAHGNATIPLLIPGNACVGEYSLTLEAYVGGQLVATTTATLSVNR